MFDGKYGRVDVVAKVLRVRWKGKVPRIVPSSRYGVP